MSAAKTAKGSRGLGLVELMVAMALGLTLTAAVMQVYVNVHRIERDQQVLRQMQETGRFVLNHLLREIRSAHRVVVDNEGDCLQLLHLTEEEYAVSTRYCVAYRNDDNRNPRSLYMHQSSTETGSTRSAALVDGVDKLLVTYGVSAPEGESPSVSAWLPAGQVTPAVQVVSVRIGVRLGADGQIALTTTATPRNQVLE